MGSDMIIKMMDLKKGFKLNEIQLLGAQSGLNELCALFNNPDLEHMRKASADRICGYFDCLDALGIIERKENFRCASCLLLALRENICIEIKLNFKPFIVEDSQN